MLKLKSDEPTLVLTNLKKVFWPDEGYTKRDLLDYSARSPRSSCRT
jgi:DNA primase